MFLIGWILLKHQVGDGKQWPVKSMHMPNAAMQKYFPPFNRHKYYFPFGISGFRANRS